MDAVLDWIRITVRSLLDRVRHWLRRPRDASPIFRQLVRNGTFEKPVIPFNYLGQRFDPATCEGWTEEDPVWGSHSRQDGAAAFGSNQWASLKQNAIYQALKTSGLEGRTLDISLYFAGMITVRIGGTTRALRMEDAVYVPGGRYYASFTHVVQPGDTPTLTLRIRGDSPQELEAETGVEVVRDFVDNVSVLTWRRDAEPPASYLMRPDGQPPVLSRQLP